MNATQIRSLVYALQQEIQAQGPIPVRFIQTGIRMDGWIRQATYHHPLTPPQSAPAGIPLGHVGIDLFTAAFEGPIHWRGDQLRQEKGKLWGVGPKGEELWSLSPYDRMVAIDPGFRLALWSETPEGVLVTRAEDRKLQLPIYPVRGTGDTAQAWQAAIERGLSSWMRTLFPPEGTDGPALLAQTTMIEGDRLCSRRIYHLLSPPVLPAGWARVSRTTWLEHSAMEMEDRALVDLPTFPLSPTRVV